MTASNSAQTAAHGKARTIGELKRIPDFDAQTNSLPVKNEIRRNLLRLIERGEPLFPGVHGYEDSSAFTSCGMTLESNLLSANGSAVVDVASPCRAARADTFAICAALCVRSA